MEKHPEDIEQIEVDEPVVLQDIDTKEDYQNATIK